MMSYVEKEPGVRNANVGMATVTQESFESQYYITRALFGTRSLFAMTAPRDFSVSLNNLTNVKITTVYRRRQNTTQNTLHNSTSLQQYKSSLQVLYVTGFTLASVFTR